MALYRNVSLSFWEDPKIVDEFTPEDKYFMLYLLTNPHTNLIGCYEISLRHMVNETGYNKDTVERLLKRMQETHKVLIYDASTKELFIKNWHKYNWTTSPNLKTALVKTFGFIKSEELKKVVYFLLETNGIDTDKIGYVYPIPTSDADTDADTDTDASADTDAGDDANPPEKPFFYTYKENDINHPFNLFWEQYPRKVKKKDCLKKFQRKIKDEITFMKMYRDVLLRCDTPEWKDDGGKYIPHPTTYLNQELWKDGKFD